MSSTPLPPINLKSELLFFLKSVFLVILLSGLLTVLAVSVLQGDASKIDAAKINELLGWHLYWIRGLAILTSAMILLKVEDRKNVVKVLKTSAKVFIYYTLLSLSFIAAQYLYIFLT
ncbi:MAG: hypothetical protein OEW60_05865 [Thiovulaceae bacterium]|nr:hypothetical protein [Sulfurimonadaceae bacterium]